MADDRQPTGGSGSDSDGAAAWPLWMRLAALLLVIMVLAVPLFLFRHQIAAFAQRQAILALVARAGPWGPLILIALVVLQIIVAPIPGQVVGFAAGYLYGPWVGLLYVWIGTVIGSSAAMVIARLAGRPLVARLIQPELLDRLDRLASRRGLVFFALVFLLPGLPDDMMCFAAGLTPLPLLILIPLAAATRLPGVGLAVWVGASAEHLRWWGWLALGGLTVVALGVTWRYGSRLQDWLMRWVGRKSGIAQ